MYKITLPINLDGYRYGIKFFKGVGETDDEKIIQLMRDKGFTVESSIDSFSFDSEETQTPARRKRKTVDSSE